MNIIIIFHTITHTYVVIILVVLAINLLSSIFFEYSILPVSSSINIALLELTSKLNTLIGINNKIRNIFFILSPNKIYVNKN